MTGIKLTAIFQKVSQGFIAFIEEVPGANTQASTMEEARENLAEALSLVLDANRQMAEESIAGLDVIREDFALPVA